MIHCKLRDKSKGDSFLASFVYREPITSKREQLWDLIMGLARDINEAWLLLGDFNSYLALEDKPGGSPPPIKAMQQFLDCIRNASLLDIPLVGERFTYEKQGVKERLDWVFGNVQWELNHPNTKAFHDLHYKSDHRLVVMADRSTINHNSAHPIFKYQPAWNLEPEFGELVKEAWNGKNWLEGRKVFVEKSKE